MLIRLFVIGVLSCIGVAWNFWRTERAANRQLAEDMREYERIERERAESSDD